MKLTDFKITECDQNFSISCRVLWENFPKPPVEIYFQTQDQPLLLDANAFLLATFLPALHAGEERIMVDATISSGLSDNLYTAAAWIADWRSRKTSVPVIEASEFAPNYEDDGRISAGVFLSGGLDSLSTLTRVRRLYPKGSPYHPETAIITFGTSVAEHRSPETQRHAFERTVARLKLLTDKFNIRLVPVYTNMLDIEANIPFWMHEYHGAAFAAVAHAVSHGKATFFLASTLNIQNMTPWGSHPFLDPLYSSDRVNIIHDGVRLSRLQKAEELTRELDDLSPLRVCNRTGKDGLNCGVCEKCVRTKLEFFAIGQSIERLFENSEISPRLIRECVSIGSSYAASCYQEIIPLLVAKNEDKLASAVRRKLRGWHRASWVNRLREAIATFDDRRLDGRIRRIKKNLRSRSP